MSRPRSMQTAEAPSWLAVFLHYSFSDKNVQKSARLELLSIAHDAISYPDDMPNTKLAELLLRWSEKNISASSWRTFQARVRKRRVQ